MTLAIIIVGFAGLIVGILLGRGMRGVVARWCQVCGATRVCPHCAELSAPRIARPR